VLYGGLLHFLPFAALTIVLATAYGWLLRVLPSVQLQVTHPTLNSGLLLATTVWGCCLGLAIAAVLIAFHDGFGRKFGGLNAVLEVWSVRIVALAFAGGIFLCLVPIVFTQIRYDWHRLTAVLFGDVSLAVLIQFLARASRVAASTAWRRVAILVASYFAGPLVLGVAFLLMAYVAAARGIDWPAFGPAMWAWASLAFLIAISLFDDEVCGPLHILYRERLSTAFIRFRTRHNASIVTAEPAWRAPIKFTEMEMEGMPELVVCASVNVADDVVPPGRFAGSFTFEKTKSGGPLTGYVATTTLQLFAGEAVLTLPAMMAIAGAAFSPLMGRTTRPGWRLLFALFDVRLGVWLPNPRKLGGHVTASEVRREDGPYRREGSRFSKDRPPRTALRPGWSYALREAFGLNSLALNYVYVTDGGHWENLGLVELLRRGCTRIVCFDASEDREQPLTALGQAIALARDELGVAIAIDTKPIWPGSAQSALDRRYARSMVATGIITYPNGTHGQLILVKNHLPADAPRDVLAYAETDSSFPFDSTLNQFFDDQRFDAYRALGEHGGKRAAALLGKPS